MAGESPLATLNKVCYVRNLVIFCATFIDRSYKLSTPHLIVYSVHIIASGTRFLGRLPQDPKTNHYYLIRVTIGFRRQE